MEIKTKRKRTKNNPATVRAYFLKNRQKTYRYANAWRRRNPDKVRKYRATYDQKHPIKVEEKNFRTKVFFLRKIDLTFDEFKAMLNEQKGLCAICGKEETLKHQSGTPRLLCIDHDHDTNVVRGLLCQKCNSAIGFFNDDSDIIMRAAEYLKKYGN